MMLTHPVGTVEALKQLAMWEINGDLEWTSDEAFYGCVRVFAPALCCAPDEVVAARWEEWKAEVTKHCGMGDGSLSRCQVVDPGEDVDDAFGLLDDTALRLAPLSPEAPF